MPISSILKRYRIDKPGEFRLRDFDPGDTCGIAMDKAEAKERLAQGVERLSALQAKLYAADRWAVLAAFQAMDAAGKDGAIKHVMSGVNPQGVQVHSFKAPSVEELDHDFLWRINKALPERGRIGIFNRSHYEVVLVERVHPEYLAERKLPAGAGGKDFWEDRFKSIRAFERHHVRNGTVVLKFFLHVSKEEQCKRLLARLEDPAKRWKFSMGDIAERKLWDRYMEAYEDAIRETSTPEAPWFVIPADSKWFARLVVAEAMIESLERLELGFRVVEGPALKELERVRDALMAEAHEKNGR